MESDKDKMWRDAQKIVTKHVLDGNPEDDTLAEYLGKTVSRDYRDYTSSFRGINQQKPLKVIYMLGKWRATQSNQDRLCQSLIDHLKETPNGEGERCPKDFCVELINDLEKICGVDYENTIINPAMAIKTLDDDELAEMVHYNKETRYRIKDTSSYPHKAIARMIMKFFSKPDLFAGTGFLTDDYIFITAAHNVREDRLKNVAEITIYFGLDGDTNRDNVKPIRLHGKDFTVPDSYLKPTDFCDIAWIDLREYAATKSAENVILKWSINDLPTTFFNKCKIPDEHGVITGNFNICGYPGMPNSVKAGKPGDPPGTQWQTPDISPQRLKDGRHLLYMDATTKGMSGSPLYILKEEKFAVNAFVVAVHVGSNGSKALGGKGNCAVPLCRHMEIDAEFPAGEAIVKKPTLEGIKKTAQDTTFINKTGEIQKSPEVGTKEIESSSEEETKEERSTDESEMSGKSNSVAVGSDIKSSHKMSEDSMLMNELKQVNLDVLYDKFHLAEVTSDIVWELDDDILQEIGLTKLEQLKYRKAKEKFKE